jgi:hypothetical protein
MLLITGLLIYIALGVYLFRLAGRTLPRGSRRTMLRATILAVFFSLTVLFGHGLAPFFALPIAVSCAIGMCWCGRSEFIQWVLFPMAIQWAAIVGISMVGTPLLNRSGAHTMPSSSLHTDTLRHLRAQTNSNVGCNGHECGH